MCLILMAYRCHPGYELLVAANRDEFHDRPTAPLGFWDDAPDVLAGRDLQEGGAWMGVTRAGRFAALTNYRDPSRIMTGAPSRGHLVSDYLRGEQSARAVLKGLPSVADRYNSFNLLLGDETGLYYYSNRAGEPRALPPGLYGLSNHLLDTPWPKLRRGLTMLRNLLEQLPAVADRYNSFNLLLGDETGLYYYSNRAGQPRALPPGLYGLSNHLLDTPWPKLRRGLTMLQNLLEQSPDPVSDELLKILTDRTMAPDAELPKTGVPLDWERWLSAIFIDAPGYGTRSSTVLRVDNCGNVGMAEATWADASRRELQLNWPIRSR